MKVGRLCAFARLRFDIPGTQQNLLTLAVEQTVSLANAKGIINFRTDSRIGVPVAFDSFENRYTDCSGRLLSQSSLEFLYQPSRPTLITHENRTSNWLTQPKDGIGHSISACNLAVETCHCVEQTP
jgi:hypothetical protein